MNQEIKVKVDLLLLHDVIDLALVLALVKIDVVDITVMIIIVVEIVIQEEEEDVAEVLKIILFCIFNLIKIKKMLIFFIQL